MTNKQVIVNFILGGPTCNSLNVGCTPYVLYSYNTAIAQRYEDGYIINTTKYSRTTSKHLTTFLNCLGDSSPIYYTKSNNIPRGILDLTNY